jgi:hypothetical protein
MRSRVLRILMRGAVLLEPDGTPVRGEVLRHGLMDSPYDLRQIARRYRRDADPSGSIPPRQWASASITSENSSAKGTMPTAGTAIPMASRRTRGVEAGSVAGERACSMGGAERRLGIHSQLCVARLAQEVAALHLAVADLLDDLHDLLPLARAPVTRRDNPAAGHGRARGRAPALALL